MGKIANEYAKHIVITSDNPRFEDPELISEQICSGIHDKSKLSLELNRKEAIKIAINKSKEFENPVILILGKGDEKEQIIYDEKIPLNDKDIVEEFFKED